MCELLGISANVTTDIRFSFTGLMQRGGGTAPHRDGWGIAFYQRNGCRTFRDTRPSVESEIARVVRSLPIQSTTAVGHIRQANLGTVSPENTPPFQRELWGQTWTYAHNGQLDGVFELPLIHYRPVGTTDSEYAFCWLLGQIRRHCAAPPKDPGTLTAFIHTRCEALQSLGVFNMLLSNGKDLYTYCSTKLSWITRRAPFGVASLSDANIRVNFREETNSDDIVTVVATEPLTVDETWNNLETGELLTFRDGLPQ